jgi:hypothetical protein
VAQTAQNIQISRPASEVVNNFASHALSAGLSSSKIDHSENIFPYSLPSLEILIYPQLGYLQVGNIIREQASKLFGSMAEIEAVATRYFTSVHQWIPMLSRRRFHKRLPVVWGQTRHDFILLLCCMHLITQVPLESELDNIAPSLYNLVKRLYGLVDSMGFVSVEMVQSKLLIAVFEMAHGLHSVAYMSIGTCARMGVVLGIDKLQRQRVSEPDSNWLQMEEESRTWWAIIITDRFEPNHKYSVLSFLQRIADLSTLKTSGAP